MVKAVSIKDDGATGVKILLDGTDVTGGCIGYAVERGMDGLPVLTLRYHAMSVEVEGICAIEFEPDCAVGGEVRYENP